MIKRLLILLSVVLTHYSFAQSVPRPDHIVIMLDENRTYSDIAGSSLAPYINSLLADPETAVFSNYYALISGSQPNYLMLFSGSTQGVVGSNITTTQFTDCNLGASLITAGYKFTGYSDSLPSVGFLGTTSGEYARKHNPWSNWQGTGTNQLSPSTNQPFTAFPADFDSLPTVSFVVPDLLDDMHTPSDATGILPGDNWFKNNLNGYIQWAKTHNSLLIFGFDESADNSEHVLFFFTGQGVKGGYYNEYVDNYRTLRTIEEMYGLPYCANSDTAKSITSCWQTSGIKNTTSQSATIDVFPVPAKDFININITSASNDRASITILDHIGRIAKSEVSDITGGKNNLTIDTHDLAPGIYLVKVAGETINSCSMITIEH